MKTYTLSEIKTIVSRLARQYGAERIYLFGSYARGEALSQVKKLAQHSNSIFAICNSTLLLLH